MRGRLLSHEAERQDLIKGLLRHYENHEPFLERLEDLRKRYRQLLRALHRCKRRPSGDRPMASLLSELDPLQLWRITHQIADEDLLDGRPRRRSPHHHLRRYMQEVQDLAKGWGLDAPWAAPILHECLLRHAEQKGPIGFLWPVRKVVTPVLPISVYLKYIPYRETWEEFEERILQEARKARDELLAQLRGRGFVETTRTEKVEEHLQWLFWLICPGHLGSATYGAVAEKASRERQARLGHQHKHVCQECYVDRDTVRKALRPLARKLGLRLPIKGRGRPRKHP